MTRICLPMLSYHSKCCNFSLESRRTKFISDQPAIRLVRRVEHDCALHDEPGGWPVGRHKLSRRPVDGPGGRPVGRHKLSRRPVDGPGGRPVGRHKLSRRLSRPPVDGPGGLGRHNQTRCLSRRPVTI